MAYRKAASILAGSCTVSAFRSTLRHRGILLSNGPHNNNLRRFSNKNILAMNSGPSFCEKCGTAMEIKIPHGDERERHVCGNSSCGFVSYQNPKVVVSEVLLILHLYTSLLLHDVVVGSIFWLLYSGRCNMHAFRSSTFMQTSN